MLLSVEDLKVSYGNIKALHGLNFKIDEGEIVCIIGANGAGKSTTLKAISRLVEAEEGTKMTFQDHDLLEFAADKVVSKLGISHVPEGRRLFENLTVTENLKLATFARKDKEQIQQDVQRVFSIFPRLEERQNQKSGTLSGGEQQMLAIGRGLMGQPKLLILDEPSLGLAPLIVRDIFTIIKELNEALNLSVLIVEQNALQTLKIADYAYVLQVGNIVKEDQANTLANDPELISAYLGN